MLLDTNLLNRVRYLLEVARVEGAAVPLVQARTLLKPILDFKEPNETCGF